MFRPWGLGLVFRGLRSSAFGSRCLRRSLKQKGLNKQNGVGLLKVSHRSRSYKQDRAQISDRVFKSPLILSLSFLSLHPSG